MKDYNNVSSCQFLAKVLVRDDNLYKIVVTYKAPFNSFEEAKQDAIKRAESTVKEEKCTIFAQIELIIQYEDRAEPDVRTISFYEL